MAKKPTRDMVGEDIQGIMPAESQKAPPTPKSKAQKRVEDDRYGVRKTYRLHRETIEAIDVLAEELGVGKGELVDYLLRAGMGAIQAGRLDVPTIEKKIAKRTITRQLDIPSAYRG